MVEQNNNRSAHAWSYTWSVLGSLTASLLLTVLPKAVGFAGVFGRVTASVPLWISFPVTFLAVIGIISAVQALVLLARARAQGQAALGQIEELRYSDIEIDLRSIAPLVVLFSTRMPEITLMLRVTNHFANSITVTHLKATVWFSQPTTEMSLDAPFEVAAHSTKNDVFLRKLLEDSATTYIKEFFARDDWAKFIAIDVTMSGTSDAGNFQRSHHFELRSHDFKGVER